MREDRRGKNGDKRGKGIGDFSNEHKNMKLMSSMRVMSLNGGRMM